MSSLWSLMCKVLLSLNMSHLQVEPIKWKQLHPRCPCILVSCYYCLIDDQIPSPNWLRHILWGLIFSCQQRACAKSRWGQKKNLNVTGKRSSAERTWLKLSLILFNYSPRFYWVILIAVAGVFISPSKRKDDTKEAIHLWKFTLFCCLFSFIGLFCK